MDIAEYLVSPHYKAEKQDMPVIQAVIDRLSEERPFQGARVAVAHLLSLNSVTMLEAFWRGGAELILCNPFLSPRSTATADELTANGFRFFPVTEAAERAEYFIDNAGSLGKLRTPKAAVEVTRTGEYVYQSASCPVISVDRSRIKYLETYMGTGESFVRGWYNLRPSDSLEGKHLVLFGYGKVGRGVAHGSRSAGARVTVVDIDAKARGRSQREGFATVDPDNEAELQAVLGGAEVVIGATGIPGTLGKNVPHDWLRANAPFLVNIGIDEFGPEFGDEEILGGRTVPINWHLHQPTLNRYIDPTLAAQVLALEELIKHPGKYAAGLHPLPEAIDVWALQEWISRWPDEDLSNLEAELGLGQMLKPPV
jgi:adenosylhomocysteinase